MVVDSERVRSAVRRRVASARPRTERERRRLVAAGTLSPAQLELLRGVSGRISHRDGMYGGAVEHYYGVGLSAVHCIEAALAAAGRSDPAVVLDLPCGHGRVLRALQARWPEARFTVSDTDRDGVLFCARAWGAEPRFSSPRFEALDLGGPFDLIWCGSLATHLDEDRIGALLACLQRHLAPQGAAVVTTHGDRTAANMRDGSIDYLLAPGVQDGLVAAYERDGFAYSDYQDMPGYGVTLTSRDWFGARAERAGLTVAHFAAAAWDDHQDVFGLVVA